MKPEHVVSAESGGDSVAAVLGETTQPAYQLSADGDITWWNEQFASVVGYTDEELSQLDAPDLFSTDAWDRFEARLTGSDETTYWTDKIDMVRKDGEQCTHHHTTSLSRNGDGETLTGIVSVADEDLPRAELLKTVQLATDRVIAAKTREEIEHALCETLGNAGLYRAVWVGEERDGRLEAVAAAGPETVSVDAFAGEWTSADEARPALVTAQTGRISTIRDIPNSEHPDGPREFTADHGFHAGCSVPLVADGTIYGVLTSYTDTSDRYGQLEETLLTQLGRVAGLAIGSVQTERLMLSQPRIELELRLKSDTVPVVRFAKETGATGEREWMTQEEDGTTVQYYTIEGAAPERIVTEMENTDNVRSARVVDADANLYEVRFAESAAGMLLAAGAETRRIELDPDGVTIVATAPEGTDVREILDRIREIYPETELRAKRTLSERGRRDQPAWPDSTELTDKQTEMVEAAFEAGYFEWPRDVTAEDLAERLDISAATLHYHLRRAQRQLVEAYLD